MKSISLLTTLFLYFFTATCNNQTTKTSMETPNKIEVEGKIEAIGMTSWQYGTHTLTNDDTFYALRSEKIDLQQYEGKTVKVTATKVEGYPVDGGPEFLEVYSIKE
ncbi:hypothetical protein FK178_13100 [Antarcticibacterium arcticum]|uniref:Uncharacterized protein n=1 Tax=Antarcticibacterium arcticum TaxID=2585771 RepID=A0A5B8YP08_9FLAO|nr:hypothetical protein [Antarcticibacterium arcticum]QED38597.1 hypothetical protein FK178_13100 [Antarcticibacterium arcticum]